MIDTDTRTYCIIGNPVKHSFSPAMHNPAFRELGVNAVYVAFEVSDLPSAVAGVRALGISGASVTIPHKVAVIPLLDEVEDIARMIGSVNTLINREGRIVGTNTDAYGFFRALNEVTPLDGKNIAVLGSGGASRAVCFASLYYAQPKNLYIVAAREADRQEAETLHRHIREHFPQKSASLFFLDRDWDKIRGEADIIVNTTPVGMHPHENQSLLTGEQIPLGVTVMDIIYNPHHTQLLRSAGERNCRLAYGIDMLLYQGVRQFELWTEQDAPVELMKQALSAKLSEKK